MLSQIRTVFGSEKLVRDVAFRESRVGRASILTSGHNTMRTEERVSTPGTADDVFVYADRVGIFERNPF